MGSPSVGSERIRSGDHLRIAGRELAKYCGISKFAATLWYVIAQRFWGLKRKIDEITISDEIGGSNGMQSLQMSKFVQLFSKTRTR